MRGKERKRVPKGSSWQTPPMDDKSVSLTTPRLVAKNLAHTAGSMFAERKAVVGPTAWPIANVEEAAAFPSPGKSC